LSPWRGCREGGIRPLIVSNLKWGRPLSRPLRVPGRPISNLPAPPCENKTTVSPSPASDATSPGRKTHRAPPSAGLRLRPHLLNLNDPSFNQTVVFRTLLSRRRLKPSHCVLSPAFLSSSVIVSSFASVLSANARARASISAGFLGEPYSSSP